MKLINHRVNLNSNESKQLMKPKMNKLSKTLIKIAFQMIAY